MNISVNGQSRIPPGFRFHPTEEELLQYYLTKKVANQKIDLDVIFEVDLNKLEPWDIQEKCRIGSGPQNDWYIFSHKDKKYPTGTRTNRATTAGFWKATGRDKVIHSNSRRIGMRKTLVFYKGRAPQGQKSDWIMHEYRLYDNSSNSSNVANNDGHVRSGEVGQEEGWVVCRIFKKKNYHKAVDHSPTNTSSPSITIEPHRSITLDNSSSDHDHDQGALEQIFHFMGAESQIINNDNNSSQAQGLNSNFKQPLLLHQNDLVEAVGPGSDWTALDRFIATHLNGHDQPTERITLASNFSSSSSPYDHHDHDRTDLPILRSPPFNSSGNMMIEVYQSAGTLDNYDYGGDEIDPLYHVAGGG